MGVNQMEQSRERWRCSIVTNDELNKQLLPYLDELHNLNQEAIQIAKAVIGESIFKTDLYFCAMLNKSLQLTDGFVDLVQNRNLACAGILLRASMDNCLRLYAMFIAENPDEVVDSLMQGEKIDGLKDKNGKKLKDFYLKEQLEKYDDKFATVYNNASGYVHFSEKGFFQSVSSLDEEYHIGIQVSHEVPEKANEYIVECVQAYLHFLRLFYWMFEDIIRVKNEYDQAHEAVDN